MDLSIAYAVGHLHAAIEDKENFLEYGHLLPKQKSEVELEIRLLKSAVEKISGEPYREKS